MNEIRAVREVEPKVEGWVLTIDCAAEGGWQRI